MKKLHWHICLLRKTIEENIYEIIIGFPGVSASDFPCRVAVFLIPTAGSFPWFPLLPAYLHYLHIYSIYPAVYLVYPRGRVPLFSSRLTEHGCPGGPAAAATLTSTLPPSVPSLDPARVERYTQLSALFSLDTLSWRAVLNCLIVRILSHVEGSHKISFSKLLLFHSIYKKYEKYN